MTKVEKVLTPLGLRARFHIVNATVVLQYVLLRSLTALGLQALSGARRAEPGGVSKWGRAGSGRKVSDLNKTHNRKVVVFERGVREAARQGVRESGRKVVRDEVWEEVREGGSGRSLGGCPGRYPRVHDQQCLKVEMEI